MTRISWLALALVGCTSTLPPPNFGPDAPDASDTTCSYRAYADGARALATRADAPTDPTLDPDLRLLDDLHGSATRLAGLRQLDRVRVACRVRVPAERWSAAVVRVIDRATGRVEDALHERQSRVDPSDLESLDGPLLDPETRHGAAHALGAVDDAVRIAMAQRNEVLTAAVDDTCTVERLTEVQTWRDVARVAPDEALRSEADVIASAIGWAPAEVESAFVHATGLAAELDDFTMRRTRALDVVARCDGEVPPELLPGGGTRRNSAVIPRPVF